MWIPLVPGKNCASGERTEVGLVLKGGGVCDACVYGPLCGVTTFHGHVMCYGGDL